MQRVSMSIVGCGKFGRHMAGILKALPQFKIVDVCDINSEAATRLGAELGVPSCTDFNWCLTHSQSSAVGLFTPNNLHASQAIAAAQAGKHIFCEKPMATNVEDCYAMIEATEVANVKLMVGHKRRLRPQYAKMAELVRSERFGRILSVHINGFYYRPVEGWWARREFGGGLLPYSGVHDLDFLRYLCGDAASIFARTPVKTNHRTDFEDALSMLIQFESGSTATLEVCWLFPNLSFREAFGVQIALERGGIVYDAKDAKRVVVEAQAWDAPLEVFEFDNEAGFTEAYVLELSSFADWILADTAPVLSGIDGLRCVEMMEAAYLSAYSGKEVQLPMPRETKYQNVRSTGAQQRKISELPQLYAQGLSMPEGPAFDQDGMLYVANCRADFVSRVSPSGEVKQFVQTGGKTQGVAIHPDGSLLITDFLQRKIFQATPQGDLRHFCDSYQDGSPLRGPNEITFGPDGRVYFTDPGNAGRGKPFGAIARIDSNQKAELIGDGLEFTNGLDFSPNGRVLYLVESSTRRILCAELDEEGNLDGSWREWVQFKGRVGPDGIRVSANGNVYVTLFGHGQVAVVSPDGKVIDRIVLPGLFPTNAIFQGSNLLVCEGQTGAIWRVATEEEGVPSYAQRTWTNGKKLSVPEVESIR